MQQGTIGSTTNKAPGATVVSKASPPPPKEMKAAAAAPKTAKPQEAPRITNPGAFFIGRDVHIYARKDHLIGLTYNDFSEKEGFAHFGPVKLLDASFGEQGQPQWALIEYKEKNARKYFNTDLVPLEGCALSLVQEVEGFDDGGDEEVEATKQ
jgi:hypothetical protein